MSASPSLRRCAAFVATLVVTIALVLAAPNAVRAATVSPTATTVEPLTTFSVRVTGVSRGAQLLLSRDGRASASDVRLRTTSRSRAVVRVQAPADAAPGRYLVLACSGGRCVASTVRVTLTGRAALIAPVTVASPAADPAVTTSALPEAFDDRADALLDPTVTIEQVPTSPVRETVISDPAALVFEPASIG